ncbi:MAG: Glu/Leu/Phe/Val dehydrogenase [Candidatus Bathyarchaeia archaeon]
MPLEEEVFQFSDEMGPEKILYVYDVKTEMKGIVVVDNTARGPAVGGVRMAPNITTEEVFRLARAMTLKNAAADIRHGGGKSGIIADPRVQNKNDLIRSFAKAIEAIESYIPGPDMGTNEQSMAIIYDETKRAVGLPRDLGGIPLDEIGSTGYGVSISTEIACENLGMNLEGATVAVEGFGAVGRATVKFLEEKGTRVVAVSDSKGTIYNPEGLRYNGLLKVKKATGAVKNYRDGEVLETRALFSLPVDILIPGARPDSITLENVNDIKAKLIVEAANIPATVEAERFLHARGILVIPDFIANAGGVITAAVEYRGGTEEEAFRMIREKISINVRQVIKMAYDRGILPRFAAEMIAKERVINAMRYRGLL